MQSELKSFYDEKDRVWTVCYSIHSGLKAPHRKWDRFQIPDDPNEIEIEWIEVRFRNGKELQVCQEVAERYIDLGDLE